MVNDFCQVCEEETRHEVREETFWNTKTQEMILDLKYVCRECGLIKRKGKAKTWL